MEEARKQIAKELHRRVVRKFQRRSVIVAGINHTWGADLVDMSEWASQNDGYKWMLVVVDIFTRYAYVEPMKTKTAREVLATFKKIVRDAGTKPRFLWSDRGKEFYNAKLNAYLKRNKIGHYSTYSEHKVSIVERFNRTLKSIMWERFTEKGTRRWIDMLPQLVKEYNHTKHSTLGMTPAEAQDEGNAVEIFTNEIEDQPKKTKPKFKLGDKVRVSRIKGTFEKKSATPNWSPEVFEVVQVLDTRPPTYKLKDHKGNILEGSFYEQEMQKTKVPDIYLVEKVLKERKRRGKKEYLVKWIGFPESEATWEDARDVVSAIGK